MKQYQFDSSYQRITESGCWLWVIGQSDRYGFTTFKGRSMTVARYSWLLHKGPIPKGLFVLHRCDVPCCVNPAHLFLGTAADNIKDAAHKGRTTRKKERNNTITQLDADEIRKLYATGNYTQFTLAARYGIQQPEISRIICGYKW